MLSSLRGSFLVSMTRRPLLCSERLKLSSLAKQSLLKCQYAAGTPTCRVHHGFQAVRGFASLLSAADSTFSGCRYVCNYIYWQQTSLLIHWHNPYCEL